MSSPRIETARLILRPTELDDFEPWCAMMSDETATRFIGGVQPPSTAWRGVMSMAGAWAVTGVAMFSVIE
jgi:RimJ/RimL family protein N-acetyltransferase